MQCSNFIVLHEAVLFSLHQLIEETVFFSILYSSLFCQRLVHHRYVVISLDFLSCPTDTYLCFCATTKQF